jgi:metallo-beta-lactamase family protein
MELEFYGGAGEVTGSCHILHIGGRKVLLDCGMIQGGDNPDARNRAPFPFAAGDIDAVILSHAHIDHSGRLPLLHKRGYRGPIYATPATRDLARILLADSAHMARREAERANRKREVRRSAGLGVAPLFDGEDAARTIQQFRTVRYGHPMQVVPGVTLTFHDAGHILGSASVWLELCDAGVTRRIVFSGDVGPYGSPILCDPVSSGGPADVVVMESTYGNRLHRDRDATLQEFGTILRNARRDGGNVLIPAFAVGRTQEVLYELSTHFEAWELDQWQIFLDSPMAIDALQVYQRHYDLYDEEARDLHRHAGQLPPLPNLRLCRTAEESMAINRLPDGAIIIAGSGMCNGGRIVHHLKLHLPRPECDVIITGFQAAGTPGRAIVERRENVRLHGVPVRNAARVHTLGGFSAHGDQHDLLRWRGGIKGKPQTWLVHGEPEGANGLCDALRSSGVAADVARPGQRINLAQAA